MMRCRRTQPSSTASGTTPTNKERPSRLVSRRRNWCLLFLFGSCVERISPHNPKVAGSNPAPATIDNEGLADARTANPFRLPRLHPGIGAPLGPHGATPLPEVNEARGWI